MKFQREPVRRLPDGVIAKVYPFHFCTKGEKIIFRTEEDFRIAFNNIPINALRSNVIPIMPCVLSSHVHCCLLARSYEEACTFALNYKKTTSMFLSHKYGIGKGSFREDDAKVLFLEDDRYVRNTICYIAGNAMDMGSRIDTYIWSGYRALFCDGKMPSGLRKVSEMSRRTVRKVFRSEILLKGVEWMIGDTGILEPASFCDWRYAESAFYGDVNFFTKVIGSVDREQMDQKLIYDPSRRKSVEELLRDIEGRSQRRYNLPFSSLNPAQKIPILKAINYSTDISVKLLARLFEMTEEKVSIILKRAK